MRLLIGDRVRAWSVFLACEDKKELELSSKHICLWTGAQFLFRLKWRNCYTVSLLLRYIGPSSCAVSKNESFFICGSGFRWMFSRTALFWKGLQLGSKTDLTTNGLTLEFFVGICLVSLTSYLLGRKFSWFAQIFFFWRHQVFSIVWLWCILVCSLNVPILINHGIL